MSEGVVSCENCFGKTQVKGVVGIVSKGRRGDEPTESPKCRAHKAAEIN